MVEIPLMLRLKKESHKDIARAQDIIIEELYGIFDRAVIHGGTGIWRCYHGNRFSEDIDVYIPKDLAKLEILFHEFEKRGFIVEKKKITENSLYSNLNLNGVAVRFEALFKKESGLLKNYETAEGGLIVVYSLSSEGFIEEKVDAYLNRLKIRDLYDIFFLLRYSDPKKIEKYLLKLIRNFKNPIDREDLKVLILEGVVPETGKMLDYIKNYIKWEDKNIKNK